MNEYEESVVEDGGKWEEGIGGTEEARCEFGKLMGGDREEMGVLG